MVAAHERFCSDHVDVCERVARIETKLDAVPDKVAAAVALAVQQAFADQQKKSGSHATNGSTDKWVKLYIIIALVALALVGGYEYRHGSNTPHVNETGQTQPK